MYVTCAYPGGSSRALAWATWYSVLALQEGALRAEAAALLRNNSRVPADDSYPLIGRSKPVVFVDDLPGGTGVLMPARLARLGSRCVPVLDFLPAVLSSCGNFALVATLLPTCLAPVEGVPRLPPRALTSPASCY